MRGTARSRDRLPGGARTVTAASQKSRSVHWLTWSAVGLGLQGAGKFIILAVLARYLTPEEFGIVTASQIVIGLGRMCTQAMVGPAVVQRQGLTRTHIESAFSLSLLGGGLAIAILCLLARPTADFFRMPHLEEVIMALSAIFLLQAPGVVPEALLQRDMRMRNLALSEAASFLLGYVPLGIVLAMTGFGVWALVVADIGQVAIKSTVVVLMRPHSRALRLDGTATRELLYFSGGMIAARFCNYSASQADRFVIARWMTPEALGIYGRAHQLMNMPAMYLGSVLDRVLFPLMAQFQSDRARLGVTYARGISLCASIMAPAAVTGVVLGPEIVRVVLGPNWNEAILPFQIMAAGLVWRTGYKISDALARATGTVYARAWRQAVFATLVLLGAFAGLPWGVAGIAVGLVTAIFVNYLLMAWLSLSTIGLSWRRFAAAHAHGLWFGSAVGAVTLLAAQVVRGQGAGPLAVLAVALAVPAALVAVAVRLSPGLVLGREGRWFVGKLRRRAGVEGRDGSRRPPASGSPGRERSVAP